jgi:hypothetical protein
MSQQNIDFGTFPDDPDADAIRTAFQKVQNNFNELFSSASAGVVTSVNQTPGAGIQVNSPTGNVIVSANIAYVQVSTSTLSIGQGSNGGTSANISQSTQTLVVDINPANVFSNNFAAVGGGLANITGRLTANSNSQPNVTSLGTLTSLAVTGNITSGNVYANSGTIGAANLTGTLTTNAQPNITSVGTLSNLAVTGNSNLGNVATANFFNGDGSGLTNVNAITGTSIVNGTSNIVVGLNGNVRFGVASNANVLIVTGIGTNVDGYLTASGNITGANITGTNANLGNAVTANYFIGNLYGTANLATYATTANAVAGANVSGQVANALVAGTVYTNAQPNITSVGTLTSLIVSGNISSGNANLGNLATANFFSGSGNNLSNIQAANITGQVANALVASTVYTNAQPNITSTGTLTSLTVSGTSNLGAVGNLTITGGGANYFLMTNGSGALTWNNAALLPAPGANTQVLFNDTGNTYGASSGLTFNKITNTLSVTNLTGTLTTNAQPNITSVGTLTSLIVNGNLNVNTPGIITGTGNVAFSGSNVTLGAVSNLRITGGSSGQYLQTDGSGTLVWAAVPVGSGISNGTSNVNIPVASGNVNITAGGTTTLVITSTGANITGNVTAGNISATNHTGTTANITGQYITTLATGTAPFIVTSTTQVANLNVATAGLATFATTANAVAGANVSGAVAFATTANAVAGANVSGTVSSATTAGTVTTAAQPNITSVGTLTSLGVNGTVTAVNFTSNTGVFAGSGANLTTLNASNISSGTLAQARLANASVTLGSTALTLGSTVTTVAGLSSVTSTTFVGALTGAATTAGSATTAGTVTTAAQPNITSVGTLTGLTVSSTISGSITGSAASATTAGTVTTAAQPNITSVGTLSSLSVSGTLTTTNITTGANSTAGTITGNWSLSAGSRLNATYADLAEKYVADADYHPGTVLVFGGEHEVTLSTTSDSFRVAGVVTTNPAYTMNNDCLGENVATIALQGRVPVKVIGPVFKGDLLVSCDNGHAIANNIARAGTIIGKSLENFTDASGVIEVAVGRF